jgi:16S rRNA (cytosine967-C5)-methyltransferase
MVIDVCSAPAARQTHMAQIKKNKGQIIARDVHEHKIDIKMRPQSVLE